MTRLGFASGVGAALGCAALTAQASLVTREAILGVNNFVDRVAQHPGGGR
jgi:hypothetical protein